MSEEKGPSLPNGAEDEISGTEGRPAHAEVGGGSDSSEPQAAVPAEVVQAECCSEADLTTVKPCTLCQKKICSKCRSMVNGKRVCEDCKIQILNELEQEKANAGNLMVALGFGIVAALIGGALWAVIAVVTKMAIGYVAVGVGYLAGYGVVMGAGKKKSFQLQVVAAGCAVLGLLFGKYFIFAHAIIQSTGNSQGADTAEKLSYFDPLLFQVFFQFASKMLSPWDILWVVFAIGVAWGMPKPTEVTVR